MIDCDIHNVLPSVRALFPYLPEWWQHYVEESGFTGPAGENYPAGAPTSTRADARPPDGGPAGSDLGLLRGQLLDGWGVEYGILNCLYSLQGLHNEDFAAALASALNDWQLAEWLQREPRLRASLVVPTQNPQLAAAEIDRLGGHGGFVQVLLPVRSEAPYGKRHFWPLFAAAERHGLPVGLHFGGSPGTPATAVGWPSYYIEEYVDMTQAFQAQVLSLVGEGVFCQYPSLRVVLIESGVTWLPALMWRFDKNWKGLRREVPWLTQPPSHYIREHIRLTMQPFDAPPEPRQILQVIDQLGSEEMLLFASDYPHGHADTLEEALPAGLPPALARRIMDANARAVYRLS
jgi:predicted TIM-barrel fold metal-dependent hydrolase